MTMTTLHIAVELAVSDPWEFGTECGDKPIRGTLTGANASLLVVRLASPLNYQGLRLVGAIVRPRHVGESTDVLAATGELMANFLFVPREISSLADIRPAEPGVAAIGRVRVT